MSNGAFRVAVRWDGRYEELDFRIAFRVPIPPELDDRRARLLAPLAAALAGIRIERLGENRAHPRAATEIPEIHPCRAVAVHARGDGESTRALVLVPEGVTLLHAEVRVDGEVGEARWAHAPVALRA